MRKVRFFNSNRNYLDGTIFESEKKSEKRRGVICLHGFARHGDEVKFHDLGKELARRGVSTFSFSLTGWGKSEGDTFRMAMDSMASDLRCAVEFFRKEAKVERVNVFAHSMGACVVAKCMFTYGKMFERIAFLAPALNQRRLQRFWFTKKINPGVTWGNYSRHLDEAKFKHSISTPRVIIDPVSGDNKTIGQNFFLHVSSIDYTTLIGGRAGVILHIHGSEDKTVPIESVKLTGCSTCRVEGGDHDLEKVSSWVPKAAEYLILNGNGGSAS